MLTTQGMAETDDDIHKEVQENAIQARAAHTHVNLHVTDWEATQWKDPVLKTVKDWIPSGEVQDLKHLLGDYVNTEEGMAFL